jgi:histone H3/H4
VRADRKIGLQFMQLSSRAREQLADLLEELAEETVKMA